MSRVTKPSAFLFPLLTLAWSACVHSHSHHVSVPVFLEAEPNDDPFLANHFGTLRPGDRFFIDGWIGDNGFDPFDGFAFTAAQPIHVDFQLWIDDPFTDLDVCLYDPELGFVVDCFETNVNPERGGVDVFAGGLDFHLVIESFLGASTYSLEIQVAALGLSATASSTAANARALAAAPPPAPAAGKSGKQAFHGYAPDEESSAHIRSIHLIEVDLQSGQALRTEIRLRPRRSS